MVNNGESITLKEQFTQSIISGILSGKYAVDEKLPPERELAVQMGISRSVVRSGLAELEANGFIEQRARRGCIVVDYRLYGKMPIVSEILSNGGEMSKPLLDSYLQGRLLMESETARLAAINRSNDDLYHLFSIIRHGHELQDGDIPGLAEQDFKFHWMVSVAGGNLLYPIIMNSMEVTIRTLLEENYCKTMKRKDILTLQERLYEAIQERDPDRAVEQMKNICNHRIP